MGSRNTKPGKKQFRGYALIFNHDKFDENRHTNRDGSAKDVKDLQKYLRPVGFNVLPPYINLSYDDVMSTLSIQSRKIDFSEYDGLLVVVMTHGGANGKLCAADRDYNIKDILNPFTTTKSLEGKPKVVLFQTCRGETEEKVVTENEDDDEEEDEKENSVVPVSLPQYKDFIIGFATPENHKSWRSDVSGTIYIQAICEELDKISGPVNMYSILTNATQATVNKGRDSTFQTPCFVSFLDECLYLRKVTETSSSMTAVGEGSHQSNNAKKIKGDNISPSKMSLRGDDMKHQTCYTWPGEGRALIFYTSLHVKEAKTLHDTLTDLKYVSNRFILNDDFEKEIKRQADDMPRAGCLMVFIIARLTEPNNGLKCCFTVNKTRHNVASVCKYFHPTECKNLMEQPKVFFFIDPQNWLEADCATGQSESVSSYTHRVTEYADFLLVFGFGKTYCHELQKNMKKEENVLENLTFVSKVVGASNKKLKILRKCYFQSSLRFDFTFTKPSLLPPPAANNVVAKNGKRECDNTLKEEQPRKKIPKKNETASPTPGTSKTSPTKKPSVQKVKTGKVPTKKKDEQNNVASTKKTSTKKTSPSKTDRKNVSSNSKRSPSRKSSLSKKASPSKADKKNVKSENKKSPQRKTVKKSPNPKKTNGTTTRSPARKRSTPNHQQPSSSIVECISMQELKVGILYEIEELNWNDNTKFGSALTGIIIVDGARRFVYFPKRTPKKDYPPDSLGKYSKKPSMYSVQIKYFFPAKDKDGKETGKLSPHWHIVEHKLMK